PSRCGVRFRAATVWPTAYNRASMSVEAVLMKCGNLRRTCEVTLAGGKVVVVEPYAIYTATTKRKHFLWFPVSKGGDEKPGWRYPEAASVVSAKPREESFTPRRDYDPFDRERLPVVHYSIPMHDGRQRWADARAAQGGVRDLKNF